VQSFGAGVERPALLEGAVACQWGSTSLAAPNSVRVEITAGEPDQLRATFDQLTVSSSDDVPGVGEAARWDPLTKTLGVLTSRNVISIHVQSEAGDDSSTAQAAGELVQLMLPRLTE
jgi:hypothetical protein